MRAILTAFVPIIVTLVAAYSRLHATLTLLAVLVGPGAIAYLLWRCGSSSYLRQTRERRQQRSCGQNGQPRPWCGTQHLLWCRYPLVAARQDTTPGRLQVRRFRGVDGIRQAAAFAACPAIVLVVALLSGIPAAVTACATAVLCGALSLWPQHHTFPRIFSNALRIP